MKQISGKSIGRIWLFILAILAVYIFKIRNRIKVRGRKNIPKENGILYVSNHQTLIDSLLIGISVSSLLDIFFHYDRVPWNAPDYDNFYKHPIGRQLIYLSKCVPVHRHTVKMEVINRDINNFCEILKESNLVVFFEGTRTRNGQIGDCKYGVARTISAVKPKYVIPIYLCDIQPIMPIKSGFNFTKIYGGHKGEIIIGKPITFSNLHDEELIKKEVKEAVLNLQEQQETTKKHN